MHARTKRPGCTRSENGISYWWAIALTDSLSIPAGIVLGGFSVIAQNSCDTACDVARATTLGGLAAALLALSLTSVAAILLRYATLAYISWFATLATWIAVAVLFAPR